MNQEANTVLMNTPFGGWPGREAGFEKQKGVYFIGIGGIGMSALAKFFHGEGIKVSGYDKTPTALTIELEKSGIRVHYEEDVENLPRDVAMVVYTPAIPPDHTELVFYRMNGYRLMKRSDVLQELTKSSFNICVAGTHGKTTISTMIAHLLRDSGFGGNAFLGGVSVNYGTNFWSGRKNLCVIEADEYDRSFLKLEPNIAIITAMDADHLDIYGTATALRDAFVDFSRRVRTGGMLLAKFGIERGRELEMLMENGTADYLTYSLDNNNATVYAINIRIMEGSYHFDVMIGDKKIEGLKLNMGGMHNVENSVAAIAVASSLEIENDKIRTALENFRGVKRRFEYIIRQEDFVFIDDYAHHPEELRALISSAKALFPGLPCSLVFQPHLYTRTRDLADGFAEALNGADTVYLLPVYPAREIPIEGVNSRMIAAKMEKGKAKVCSREELPRLLEKSMGAEKKPGILITAGAGDIDALVEIIKELFDRPGPVTN